ncbi:BTAD domain-containing putative transcriptional regulator [Streptomyces boninensis]|uniref:BTAD domain-containing putative transcriptional regulator n=1 Tax=Streptomyces boninensis TaxID=2039455 RepID=UPI003B218C21
MRTPSPPLTTGHRLRRLVTALSRGCGLLVLIAGVPCVLWYAGGGLPWPEEGVTSLDDLWLRLSSPVADPLLIWLLVLVGWYLWASFVCAVVREVVWYVSHVELVRLDQEAHDRHVEGLSASRTMAALCVGGLLLALLSILRPHQVAAGGHPMHPPSSAVLTSQALQIGEAKAATVNSRSESPQPAAENPEERQPVEYIVRPGDTLWDIADTHLGDGVRWPRIYALSKDIIQPDGRRLTDPDLIDIGWHLRLPAEARTDTSAGSPPRSPAPPKAEPGPEQSPPLTVDEPAAPHAPSATAGPDSPSSGTERRPAPQGAISIGNAGLIGLTTAAGITAAIALARAHTRRRRTPDLTAEVEPLAPAVLSANHADLADRGNRSDTDPGTAEADEASAPTSAPAIPGSIMIAVCQGQEIPVDVLATPGGWSLTGPGAPAMLRALTVAVATAAQRLHPAPPSTHLICSRPLAMRLLPGAEDLLAGLPGLVLAEDDDHACALAERELLQHTRQADDTAFPSSSATAVRSPTTILLIATGPHHGTTTRLAELVTRAARERLAVIALETPRLARHAELAFDGTISGVPSTGPLFDSSMFTVSERDARDILTLCRSAMPTPPQPRRAAPAAPVTPAAGRPVARPRQQHRSTTGEPNQPGDSGTGTSTCPDTRKSVGPSCQIRLLGGLSLHTANGGEYEHGIKGRTKEFLSLLATYPDGVRTDALAEHLRLAPEPERRKRELANLRRAVRRVLRAATSHHEAAFVLHHTDRHRLDPQLVTSDVHDFTTSIDAAARAGGSDRHLASLREATALYAGPLCEGADYPWADALRERLHRQAVDALVLLAEHHSDTGETTAATELLERAAALDPVNEGACQRLIRLHQAAGRPEAAARAYDRLDRHLAAIGVQPDAATRDQLEQHRAASSTG